MAKRRRFTAAFKARVALEALRGDKTVQELAVKHQVHPNQVSTWKGKASDGLVGVFAGEGGGRSQELEKQVKQLPRQDRGVGGGEGFLGERVRALSRESRRALVRRDHPKASLSLRAGCWGSPDPGCTTNHARRVKRPWC